MAKLTPKNLVEYQVADVGADVTWIAMENEEPRVITSCCVTRTGLLFGTEKCSVIKTLWSGEMIFEKETNLASQGDDKDENVPAALDISLGFERKILGYVLSSGKAGITLNPAVALSRLKGSSAFLKFMKVSENGIFQKWIRQKNCAALTMHPKTRRILVGLNALENADVLLYEYTFVSSYVENPSAKVDGAEPPVEMVIERLRRIQLKSLDYHTSLSSVSHLHWCSSLDQNVFLAVYKDAGVIAWDCAGTNLFSLMPEVSQESELL